MLATTTEAENRDSLEMVLASYLVAEESGQRIDRDEWLARHSDFADELRAFFDSRERVPRLWTNTLRFQTPCHFGDYELLEEIAHGGMGVVYKARQLRPNRIVALKLIRDGQFACRADVERFHAEAQAAASLDHPNIVPIYEVGQYSGQHFFTMKFIDGGSLADTLARSASEGNPRIKDDSTSRLQTSAKLKTAIIHPKSSAQLLSTISRAVHYAHQRGILHRDLKPANILLDVGWDKDAQQPTAHRDAVPYITDFGLAKRFSATDTQSLSGTIVGTASYMAPEQAAGGKSVTTAADIYSLGAILYELLTGRPPFKTASALETLQQVRDRDVTPPRSLNPAIDRDLETICLKCLEKEPSRRYGSAELLADDLDRWLAHDPILARPASALERNLCRFRKNPLTASLIVALVLIVSLGLFGVLTQWQAALASEQKAVTNEQKANDQRDEAQRQRDEVDSLNKKLLTTQDKLQRMLYASEVSHTKFALDQGAVDRAREMLQQLRPRRGERDSRAFEWFYLDRLCHRDLLTFRAHASRVHSVAYSPDGARIASVGGDNAVKIWDAQTGRQLLWLAGSGGIDCIGFSPDGKRLACISGDWESKSASTVWDAESGEKLLSWSDTGVMGYAIAFSPDGKRIATSAGSEIKLRDAETGRDLATFKALTGNIHSLAFSPDGRHVACGGGLHPKGKEPPHEGEVIILDSHSGETALELKGHTGLVHLASFSHDGNRLATASRDKTARIWDAKTGKELLTLSGHSDQVEGAVFSPDGTRVATYGDDHSLQIWDAKTGDQLTVLKGMEANALFSPDGKRLVTGTSGGLISFLDLETVEPLIFRSEQARGPVAYSRDGKFLATAGGDAAVIWDIATRSEVLTMRTRPGRSQIYYVAFSPDGKYLAVRGSHFADGENESQGPDFTVFDAKTGAVVHDLTADCPRPACPPAFSPDGKRLAVGGVVDENQVVRVWDVATGRRVLDFKGHKNAGPITNPYSLHYSIVCAFSPDSRRVASALREPGRGLMIWDAETGEQIWTVGPPQFPGAQAIAFSPDGQRLACASRGNIRILDAQSGAELLQFSAQTRWIKELAYSPDGKRLATASSDGATMIWDAEIGQELLSVAAPNAGLPELDHTNQAIAFSPNGEHLAVSSAGVVNILTATPLSPSRPSTLLPPLKGLGPFTEGWYVMKNPAYSDRTFEVGLDSNAIHAGKSGAFIKYEDSENSDTPEIGLRQMLRADDYRGRRVRFSGYLKTTNVGSLGAFLVMTAHSQMERLAYANTLGQPMTGTYDWTNREIVLDVPDESVYITFGFNVIGAGSVWADDFQFEIVGQDVPTTHIPVSDVVSTQKVSAPEQAKPLNLDFEK